MKNISINQINNWLEEKAKLWEEQIKTSPQLSGSDWPEYYRGLKNFDKLEKFTISTYDLVGEYNISYVFPINRYIKENNLQYKYEGGTGYCNYIRL